MPVTSCHPVADQLQRISGGPDSWYREHVSPKFVYDRNQIMAILNQKALFMEIVKLIGSDVLPDDQKLTLEIARVIRLGFLQQNAFHQRTPVFLWKSSS